MIRKLRSGKYRLAARKRSSTTGQRRNLGTFSSRAGRSDTSGRCITSNGKVDMTTKAPSESKSGAPKRRAKPGATDEGKFYHIELRPRSDFRTFRTQDVGGKGGIERVAGKRSDGTWDTQKWLVAKSLAHVSGKRLVPDHEHARALIEQFRSRPVQISGDRFKASPRPPVRPPRRN